MTKARYATMIVRSEHGQLWLTEQTEHARLAAELVDCWGGVCAPVEPREPVRLAAALHDAGWAEADARPLVNPETGRPYSFLDIPQDVHVAAHTRTVRRARQAAPYAGLLTSLHSAGLYRDRYGYLPHIPSRPVAPQWRAAVDRFLAEQDAVQAELTAALRPDPAVLQTHYRWFQLWDMLSLYCCMLTPAGTPVRLLCAVPRAPGGEEIAFYLRGTDGVSFEVDPWPFHVEQITLRWPARVLPDRPYRSDEDLQADYAKAPVQEQEAVLHPRRGNGR